MCYCFAHCTINENAITLSVKEDSYRFGFIKSVCPLLCNKLIFVVVCIIIFCLFSYVFASVVSPNDEVILCSVDIELVFIDVLKIAFYIVVVNKSELIIGIVINDVAFGYFFRINII